MKDLRRRFERFCLKNRGKGIPNLMLVIAIGNLAVFALSYIDPRFPMAMTSMRFGADRSGGCFRTSLRT